MKISERFFNATRILLMSTVSVALITLKVFAVEESTPVKSDDAIDPELAIKQFIRPTNFNIALWASEPQLKNPVAFCFDEKGAVYVAQTYRYHTNVLDIRNYMQMYFDDLACTNVNDRIAEVRKFLGKDGLKRLTENSEVIRKLEDTTGSGRADRSLAYAWGFTNVLDGIGSGVLSRKGKLYYTCIPSLWELDGTHSDGSAANRKSLSYGYGVRFGYTGHDSHGLRMGPDGKLYFSIGDRGLNVTNKEGKVLYQPFTGSVLRCNLDGSELEIFHTGLRNPQELAFDDFGNLFTGDNNCDHGDAARIVYVAEGGDSGWRIGNQFSETTAAGLWNSENLWYLQYPGQAAYIVPPVGHVGNGPSGFTHYPGVGFPEKYRDHFFLADFRGASANSGIHSIALQQKGAGFEVTEDDHFLWQILATDCDFSPDGQFYVSDWVRGWPQSQLGRIYRLYDPEIVRSALVQETRRILSEGMETRSITELASLLAHADQRVRQEAQFELADRAINKDGPSRGASQSAIALLSNTALNQTNLLARLHAIWGLGQVAHKNPSCLENVVPLLMADHESEVRAQSAKVLGDLHYQKAVKALIAGVTDSNPRVRYFAAISLGKLGRNEAVQPLLQLLRENNDKDAFIRHAAVMGLIGTADKSALVKAATSDSVPLRMGVLLAMRHLRMSEISFFLHDTEPLLVMEAARAINDLNITQDLPQLAELIGLKAGDEHTQWRVVNANFRIGNPENASRLAKFSIQSGQPEWLRKEAILDLGNWETPSFRDRLTGLPAPLKPRDPSPARQALDPVMSELLYSPSSELAMTTLQAIRDLKMKSAAPLLAEVAANLSALPVVRAQALRMLSTWGSKQVASLSKMAVADTNEMVRAAGYSLQASASPETSMAEFSKVLESGSISEKQTILATIGGIESPSADKLILDWMDRMNSGKVPPEIRLDIVEAAQHRNSPEIKARLKLYYLQQEPDDALSKYADALAGGNAELGRKLFLERQDLACTRCHKVNGFGGSVGPELSGIIQRHDRNYILESIVYPNKQIAPGFENLLITLKDGKVVAGIKRSEDQQKLILYSAEENGEVPVNKNEIKSIVKGQSPMPEGLVQMMTLRDLRNIIEFLATTK